MPILTSARVGIIGLGTIGRIVASQLGHGAAAGCRLECIVDSRPIESPPAPQIAFGEALTRCDVIIECAGQQTVHDHAENILDAGIDLLISSVGALADPGLERRLSAKTHGRLFLTPGAIGGLDILSAAAAAASFDKVRVTTSKLPHALVQDWMTPEESARIAAADSPYVVFTGSAREAATRFPRSLNVAASVSIAVGDWDCVEVTAIADPAATLTSHVIDAAGPAGTYRFDIQNRPLADNPRTSGVVPYAIVSSLRSIIGSGGGFI